MALCKSFQKTDELHMLITKVCLDPQVRVPTLGE